jgi:hypothetical protein
MAKDAGNMQLTETESEVIRIIKARQKLGRERYGKGISFKQNPDPSNWINEAIEEAADMLQYLVAMKLAMEKKDANCGH